MEQRNFCQHFYLSVFFVLQIASPRCFEIWMFLWIKTTAKPPSRTEILPTVWAGCRSPCFRLRCTGGSQPCVLEAPSQDAYLSVVCSPIRQWFQMGWGSKKIKNNTCSIALLVISNTSNHFAVPDSCRGPSQVFQIPQHSTIYEGCDTNVAAVHCGTRIGTWDAACVRCTVN